MSAKQENATKIQKINPQKLKNHTFSVTQKPKLAIFTKKIALKNPHFSWRNWKDLGLGWGGGGGLGSLIFGEMVKWVWEKSTKF